MLVSSSQLPSIRVVPGTIADRSRNHYASLSSSQKKLRTKVLVASNFTHSLAVGRDGGRAMRRCFIDQVRSAVACVVQCEERLGNRHGHARNRQGLNIRISGEMGQKWEATKLSRLLCTLPGIMPVGSCAGSIRAVPWGSGRACTSRRRESWHELVQ